MPLALIIKTVLLEHFRKYATVVAPELATPAIETSSLQDDRSVNDDRSLSQYPCNAGHSSSALILQCVNHCIRASDSDSGSCCVSILNNHWMRHHQLQCKWM